MLGGLTKVLAHKRFMMTVDAFCAVAALGYGLWAVSWLWITAGILMAVLAVVQPVPRIMRRIRRKAVQPSNTGVSFKTKHREPLSAPRERYVLHRRRVGSWNKCWRLRPKWNGRRFIELPSYGDKGRITFNFAQFYRWRNPRSLRTSELRVHFGTIRNPDDDRNGGQV